MKKYKKLIAGLLGTLAVIAIIYFGYKSYSKNVANITANKDKEIANEILKNQKNIESVSITHKDKDVTVDLALKKGDEDKVKDGETKSIKNMLEKKYEQKNIDIKTNANTFVLDKPVLKRTIYGFQHFINLKDTNEIKMVTLNGNKLEQGDGYTVKKNSIIINTTDKDGKIVIITKDDKAHSVN